MHHHVTIDGLPSDETFTMRQFWRAFEEHRYETEDGGCVLCAMTKCECDVSVLKPLLTADAVQYHLESTNMSSWFATFILQKKKKPCVATTRNGVPCTK